jgi:hypothetical protein
MEEWFYVKNDLKVREDIKEVIIRPIWSRFSLRRSKIEIDETVEACQRAFSTVCSKINRNHYIRESALGARESWSGALPNESLAS